MIDTDYVDYRALHANTPAQAESVLHSLEQTAGGTGRHVTANKTEFMWFKRGESISTLSGRSLKLVDMFPYLGSNIPLTESDINIRLAKAWTAINRL